MATEGAMGRRRAAAIERITKYAESQAGSQPADTFPKHSRHGTDMLFVLQLEWLADYFDGIPTGQGEEATKRDRQLPTLDAVQGLMNPPLEQAESVQDKHEEGEESESGYSDMTNAELSDLIDERGLDKGKAHTKAALIAVLEAADKELENG